MGSAPAGRPHASDTTPWDTIRKKNLEKVRAHDRERYKVRGNDPIFKAKGRDGMLRRTYGITQAEYDALIAKQGGGCALCATPYDGTNRKSFHVDHDHKTGRVRGVLCQQCNQALGHMGDSVEGVQRAIDYVTGKLTT